MDERVKRLAYNLVHNSCRVQPGEKVYVHYTGMDTQDLARALIKEVYEAGVRLLIIPIPEYSGRFFYTAARSS